MLGLVLIFLLRCHPSSFVQLYLPGCLIKPCMWKCMQKIRWLIFKIIWLMRNFFCLEKEERERRISPFSEAPDHQQSKSEFTMSPPWPGSVSAKKLMCDAFFLPLSSLIVKDLMSAFIFYDKAFLLCKFYLKAKYSQIVFKKYAVFFKVYPVYFKVPKLSLI